MKRNVVLTEKGWAAIGRAPQQEGVPIIGSIAAGVPISAIENHDAYLNDLTPAPGRIALLVRGDSMVNAGINDGDYAIIDANKPITEAPSARLSSAMKQPSNACGGKAAIWSYNPRTTPTNRK